MGTPDKYFFFIFLHKYHKYLCCGHSRQTFFSYFSTNTYAVGTPDKYFFRISPQKPMWALIRSTSQLLMSTHSTDFQGEIIRKKHLPGYWFKESCKCLYMTNELQHEKMYFSSFAQQRIRLATNLHGLIRHCYPPQETLDLGLSKEHLVKTDTRPPRL